ncbi:MAG: aspartate/glutamate racemase family protein [Saprospiraceae bacterium]
MKTIGLIGGMSWESSALYYKIINQKTQQLLGRSHSCQCLMYSVDFEEIAFLQHQGDWGQLREIMIDAGRRLEAGGADFIVICTNTMHKLSDEMAAFVNIPILHIVDAAAEAIQKESLNKLGLIATKFSMEENFLKDRYKTKFNIDTIIPSKSEREDIHQIIYGELVKGIINPASKLRYQEIIHNLTKEGAQGIIAGCTEIELLIKPNDISVPLFETSKIHAERAVTFALE